MTAAPRKRAKANTANAAKARDAFAATSGPAALVRVERRGRVMRLRNNGKSLREIAEIVGVSPETVKRDIALAIKDHLQVPVDEHIANSLSRIEGIRAELWRRMLNGDDKAPGDLIKLEQRQSTLLGLDAPSRVTVGVSTEDYAATLAGLMLDMGITPPDALASSLQRPAIGAAPPGPPAANDGVPQEIIDVDFEDTANEPWV